MTVASSLLLEGKEGQGMVCVTMWVIGVFGSDLSEKHGHILQVLVKTLQHCDRVEHVGCLFKSSEYNNNTLSTPKLQMYLLT